MDDNELYERYLYYISTKNKSKGWEALMKISNEAFEKFKSEYDRNDKLKRKIELHYLSSNRNKKINFIIDEVD